MKTPTPPPSYSALLAEAIKASGLKAPEFASAIQVPSAVVLAALNDEGPLPHEAYESIGNLQKGALRGLARKIVEAIGEEEKQIAKISLKGPQRALLLAIARSPACGRSTLIAATETVKKGQVAAEKAAAAKEKGEAPSPGPAPKPEGVS